MAERNSAAAVAILVKKEKTVNGKKKRHTNDKNQMFLNELQKTKNVVCTASHEISKKLTDVFDNIIT